MIYAMRNCLDEAHATVAAPLVIADENRKRSGMQSTPFPHQFTAVLNGEIVLHDVTRHVAQSS